jgi:uncharacterized protein (DUF305 family)
MRRAFGRLILLIWVSAVTLAASQQSSHSHTPAHMAPSYWNELIEIMNRMHLAVTFLEPSGNEDNDFVKLMLPHHQAAIDMAKAELQHGKDPQMRRLAQEIIADQQSEIELMQLWLKQAHTY